MAKQGKQKITLAETKADFRRQIRKKLKTQSEASRIKKSEAVIKKLKEDPDFRKSNSFMVYVSTEEEVRTRSLLELLLQAGKCVTVPFVEPKTNELIAVEVMDFYQDLIPGRFGILEPRPDIVAPFNLDDLDIVLVSGLAFDKKNFRLGRGKGYYDRFLKRLSPRTKTYGLAFDFQVFKAIPVALHDEKVDKVITN
ncbi:MAG: 5-formyltetrahydrofolate cyclo-ligase [Omnitrophica bacterium RIFCSPLOWO2_12_FULL_44_17]|uniref:5-formyltetrahydrofolate cyclo-ligase n=1 Tax=Candidatus Danuiimicrobium aquiferis TaxID=1801832 RepID=A0A1G1L1B9_9BACT|nr:MAG: 5-formyltetrahydrofolate cyclo-ligase [Omnitrophica bacterium RIFCSPHIGHO2_02_FULL_45_28]OGW88517.1 MAG: 5-formyltetrahydrofolate cyclo-ligase [Omnitrophica bacterium RIFCSPHIGHO2_12_FULL_44_12]OGW98934.1 MAG: 5-formyltetrahydrofolate cyclo-ligase [Omnitrophica bacterium RIFCSPLOWO2_12_FULL_44_17]OGX02027.1 MAG: 5-formyltetrahydrofolate cyclo-ligase [Omnitrophica bacterium RIFCSPLOWO2_02_FULL_44_11]